MGASAPIHPSKTRTLRMWRELCFLENQTSKIHKTSFALIGDMCVYVCHTQRDRERERLHKPPGKLSCRLTPASYAVFLTLT